MNNSTRSGFIAIVGRPNVGKSTLTNQLVGQKVSIITSKAQTTRHKIIGIDTKNNSQAVYIDTPGIHYRQKTALNRYMNRAAQHSMVDVNLILFIVEAARWQKEDDMILKDVISSETPVILVVNKVDSIKDKNQLLPELARLSGLFDFLQVVPLSALDAKHVKTLAKLVHDNLPEHPFYYDPDQLSDKNDRFFVAETIREKLFRTLGDELPYITSVEVKEFNDEEKIVRIAATIWVEREGQKKIIIGKNGQVLKKIGTQARKDLERLFDKKVFLQTWVKVKANWSDDEEALKTLGYD